MLDDKKLIELFKEAHGGRYTVPSFLMLDLLSNPDVFTVPLSEANRQGVQIDSVDWNDIIGDVLRKQGFNAEKLYKGSTEVLFFWDHLYQLHVTEKPE